MSCGKPNRRDARSNRAALFEVSTGHYAFRTSGAATIRRGESAARTRPGALARAVGHARREGQHRAGAASPEELIDAMNDRVHHGCRTQPRRLDREEHASWADRMRRAIPTPSVLPVQRPNFRSSRPKTASGPKGTADRHPDRGRPPMSRTHLASVTLTPSTFRCQDQWHAPGNRSHGASQRRAFPACAASIR